MYDVMLGIGIVRVNIVIVCDIGSGFVFGVVVVV